LVYVVEDWETIEEYADHKQGYYQVLSRDEGVEVRVKVGKLGFEKVFTDPKDKLLERIMKFLGSPEYIEVEKNIWDENFFK
jgi:hypothetical protein